MIFTVKKVFNMEIIEVEKLSTIYGGNPSLDQAQI